MRSRRGGVREKTTRVWLVAVPLLIHKPRGIKLFDMCLVSTVFLGLDHGFFGGPPVLFETMAFWRGEHGGECERCSTWSEAEAQHARMCTEVVRPAAMMAYVLRTLKEWWQAASWDLSYRWREFRGIELTEMEQFCQNFSTQEDNW